METHSTESLTPAESGGDSDSLVAALAPIILDSHGRPRLLGHRCRDCGAVFICAPLVCASCGVRGTIERFPLSERGRLYTYTIVHRSFPGISTPFVAAVVDLQGGGCLRGTLLDVPPDPAQLPPDMEVRVVFRITDQKDAQGKRFLAYYFVPCGSAPT